LVLSAVVGSQLGHAEVILERRAGQESALEECPEECPEECLEE
jgi:hypothetical protein